MNNLPCFSAFLKDENTTLELGKRVVQIMLSTQYSENIIIYLQGGLGAGKTTFSRAIIRELGYQGKVKSPTYNLVEEYSIDQKKVYHFDLYRLNSPMELEFIGIREYFNLNTICLIEWPEKGGNFIPNADLVVDIKFDNFARSIAITGLSDTGKKIVKLL